MESKDQVDFPQVVSGARWGEMNGLQRYVPVCVAPVLLYYTLCIAKTPARID
jgi:hypothetical protein